MTNPNKSLLVLVVDRSGSMATNNFHLEMEVALKSLIEDQKKEPGYCELYVAQFDDQYLVTYDGNLQNAHAVNITPRGSTAMLGAIGKTITDVGNKLSRLPESERPGHVVVAIITDGYENHSKYEEWSKPYDSYEKIKYMIDHQTEKYGWNFTYLGANQDAITVGAKLGVAYAGTMTYAPTSAGSASASASLGAYTSTVRSGGQGQYTNSQRKGAMAS